MPKTRRREIAAELSTLIASLAAIVAALGLIIQIYHSRKATPAFDAPQASLSAPAAPTAASSEASQTSQTMDPPSPPVDLTAQSLAPIEAESRTLRDQLAREDARVHALQSSLDDLHRRIESTRRSEALRVTQAQTQMRIVSDRVREAAQLERDRQGLASLIADARAQRARAEARAQVSQAVLPFKGSNGTWRRPIPIECKDEQAILQPSGEAFSLLELSPSRASMSGPLERALLRTVRRMKDTSTPDGKPAVPYILFLVRPDGIRAFYEARARLEQLGIAFGYELVDANALIDFPNLEDPREWSELPPPMLFPQPSTPSSTSAPALLASPGSRGSLPEDDPALQPWPIDSDPTRAAASGKPSAWVAPPVDLARVRDITRNAGSGRPLGTLPGQTEQGPSAMHDQVDPIQHAQPLPPSASMPGSVGTIGRQDVLPNSSRRVDSASNHAAAGLGTPPRGDRIDTKAPAAITLPEGADSRDSLSPTLAPHSEILTFNDPSHDGITARRSFPAESVPGAFIPSDATEPVASPDPAPRSANSSRASRTVPNDGRVEIFPHRSGLAPDELNELRRIADLDPRGSPSSNGGSPRTGSQPPASARAGAGLEGGPRPSLGIPATDRPTGGFSGGSLDLVNRSRSLEIVLTCQNQQLRIRPGLTQIPLQDLEKNPEQVTNQLRELFHAAWRASPETGIRPRILILIEPDAAATYRAVRRQLTLAGVAWPIETRQAEPGAMDAFARSLP
jgi:hypothetical protein